MTDNPKDPQVFVVPSAAWAQLTRRINELDLEDAIQLIPDAFVQPKSKDIVPPPPLPDANFLRSRLQKGLLNNQPWQALVSLATDLLELEKPQQESIDDLELIISTCMTTSKSKASDLCGILHAAHASPIKLLPHLKPSLVLVCLGVLYKQGFISEIESLVDRLSMDSSTHPGLLVWKFIIGFKNNTQGKLRFTEQFFSQCEAYLKKQPLILGVEANDPSYNLSRFVKDTAALLRKSKPKSLSPSNEATNQKTLPLYPGIKQAVASTFPPSTLPAVAQIVLDKLGLKQILRHWPEVRKDWAHYENILWQRSREYLDDQSSPSVHTERQDWDLLLDQLQNDLRSYFRPYQTFLGEKTYQDFLLLLAARASLCVFSKSLSPRDFANAKRLRELVTRRGDQADQKEQEHWQDLILIIKKHLEATKSQKDSLAALMLMDLLPPTAQDGDPSIYVRMDLKYFESVTCFDTLISKTFLTNPKLCVGLIRMKAEQFYLTNIDLQALFDCAQALQVPHLAWRSLTVLSHRDCLSPRVRNFWSQSPECRSLPSSVAMLTSFEVSQAVSDFIKYGPVLAEKKAALSLLSYLTDYKRFLHERVKPLKEHSAIIKEAKTHTALDLQKLFAMFRPQLKGADVWSQFYGLLCELFNFTANQLSFNGVLDPRYRSDSGGTSSDHTAYGLPRPTAYCLSESDEISAALAMVTTVLVPHPHLCLLNLKKMSFSLAAQRWCEAFLVSAVIIPKNKNNQSDTPNYIPPTLRFFPIKST